MSEEASEKVQEQAGIILAIGRQMLILDTEYLSAAADRFYEKADFNLSAMLLNPTYIPSESTLLKKQADAMRLLCQYKDTLKEIDELKSEISKEKKVKEEIIKMFY